MNNLFITVIYFNSEHIAQLHGEAADQSGVTAPVA